MVQAKKAISRLISLIIASRGKSLCVWAITLVCFSSLVPVSQGCYLRNCPLGKREGKRTTGPGESTVVNTCPVCGLNGVGQCFGPFTCCTPENGCIMGVGLPETAPCAKETNVPIPCTADGKKCGYNGEGVCASRGVCCTEERCEFTMECATMHKMKTDFRQLLRGY